jgi:hypothetical protein
MNIIFHLGMAKSASTLLQNIMIHNQKILECLGIAYVHDFRKIALEKEKLLDFIRSTITDYPDMNLLFSNENFFNPNLPDEKGIYPGSLHAVKILDAVINDLGSNFNFKFIFIARNPLDFYISAFSQLKKQGAKISPENYLKSFNQNSFSFSNIDGALHCLQKLGAVNVINYSMINSDLVQFLSSFFASFGVDFKLLECKNFTVNSSINENGFKILEICKSSLDPKNYMQMRHMVQKLFPKTDPYYWELDFRNNFESLAETEHKLILEKWRVMPPHSSPPQR